MAAHKSTALSCFASGIALCMICASPVRAAAPLEPETDYTEKLPPLGPHWTLVATGNDAYTLYDADKAKLMGTVPADFESNIAVAPDRHAFYVATTLWTRGDHGDREDFLQEYDSSTLTLTHEIAVPPRALAVFKQQDLGLSNDGRWAFLFDMTPTTRVTVVDLHADKVATTVDIPGCALSFPWKSGGFSSLCGNGGLTNVAYDGKSATITHTAPFFDANEAPVFEQSPVDPVNGVAYFITYDGRVFETKLGPNAKPAAPWGLAEAAGEPPAGRGVQELAWRPGGVQPFAYSSSQQRLYVLMHVGHYWSHKDPANDVWVINTHTHKAVARYHLPAPAVAISVSQDASPQIYAVTGGMHEPGKLTVIDAKTGKIVHDIDAGARPSTVVAGM